MSGWRGGYPRHLTGVGTAKKPAGTHRRYVHDGLRRWRGGTCRERRATLRQPRARPRSYLG